MLKGITMMKDFQQQRIESPQDELVISDLETLKVLSDPLRMQLIELMGDQPRTVKQVAQQLEMTPNKLYYHIRLLEDHGLIRVVETHIVSGIVEKHYQTTAKEITVADGLLSISKPEDGEEIEALVSSILDGAKADFKRSLRVRSQGDVQSEVRYSTNITREMARLTREQANTIRERLAELVKEFEAYDDESEQEERQTFALTTLFYPSFSIQDSPASGEDNE
jgi:DNA-binding transcriptional ArsR family regulator